MIEDINSIAEQIDCYNTSVQDVILHIEKLDEIRLIVASNQHHKIVSKLISQIRYINLGNGEMDYLHNQNGKWVYSSIQTNLFLSQHNIKMNDYLKINNCKIKIFTFKYR